MFINLTNHFILFIVKKLKNEFKRRLRDLLTLC